MRSRIWTTLVLALVLAAGVMTGQQIRASAKGDLETDRRGSVDAKQGSRPLSSSARPSSPSRSPGKAEAQGPVETPGFDAAGNLLIPAGQTGRLRLNPVGTDGSIDEATLAAMGLDVAEIAALKKLTGDLAEKARLREEAGMRQLSRSDEGEIWALPGNPDGERDKAQFLEQVRSYSGVPGLLEAKIMRTHDLDTRWFDSRHQFVEVTPISKGNDYSYYLVPPEQAVPLLDGNATIEEIRKASTEQFGNRPSPRPYLRRWLKDS